jgi:FAD/FMN-containing dehydrogenase
MSELSPTTEAGPAMHGRFLVAGGPGWEQARHGWNLVVDQRPAAVALPETAEDVAAVLEWARVRGLAVKAQGTGHAAAAGGPLGRTVLVNTSSMRHVRVDPIRRRARVGAGAVWHDVTVAAGEHGLAGLAGSSPNVGVVGYCLGGGLSWLGRNYGLACNSVMAVELVTVDGRVRHVDAEHDADLFWAVRGGGGNFGVVTAMEVALYPVPEVYAGALFWPWERTAEVLHAWREWTASLPVSVTSVARVLQLPELPELPPQLRGGQFVAVEAAHDGDAASGEALLAPLRALGPQLDTFEVIPAPALDRLHMDPEDPMPAVGDHRLLETLPEEAVDELAAAAGPGSGSSLLSVELRHLGGALATAPDGHGALASIGAAFLLFGVAVATDPATTAAARSDLGRVTAAVGPWQAEHALMNFSEEPRDAAAFHSAETYARLRALRGRYDPDEVIQANHPVSAPR